MKWKICHFNDRVGVWVKQWLTVKEVGKMSKNEYFEDNVFLPENLIRNAEDERAVVEKKFHDSLILFMKSI